MSLSEAIPVLGPIFADASFRWWLLGTLVAIGPVPEEHIEKIDRAGVITEVRTTRWRWGGLLRIALIGVVGHSRLADRVGSLETAVDGMTGTMRELIVEFRTHRGAVVDAGGNRNVATPVVNTVRCDDVEPRRTSVPSRPQLRDG
jgi:hypothetical protein